MNIDEILRKQSHFNRFFDNEILKTLTDELEKIQCKVERCRY